jgi:tRNA-Thr(GGU) m(6)t(6)A37 methyltransferase TsaA
VGTPRPRVIGRIRTSHTSFEDTPVQATLNMDEEGTVELEPRYAEALDGLSGFSHVWLLTWLAGDEQPPEPELRQVPFLLRRTPRLLGTFATRSPKRPTPIGLSLVRLVAVEGSTLRFRGVDMVDGTLLLDLKPYFADVDVPDGEVRCGWMDTVTLEKGSTPASLEP